MLHSKPEDAAQMAQFASQEAAQSEPGEYKDLAMQTKQYFDQRMRNDMKYQPRTDEEVRAMDIQDKFLAIVYGFAALFAAAILFILFL